MRKLWLEIRKLQGAVRRRVTVTARPSCLRPLLAVAISNANEHYRNIMGEYLTLFL
jgi:hypothetical protein